MPPKKGKEHGFEPAPLASGAVKDPALRLVAGVMVKASEEAQEGDLGACEWLAESELARLFCDALGLDSQVVRRMAERWADKPAGRIIVRILGGYPDGETGN